MKHIYLSPHLDDAVLSCGGAIHRYTTAGHAVLVITVFSREYSGNALSPFALEQHGYWGNPPEPMALRRAEDTAALTWLGAQGQHLDYLDAVYRAHPDIGWLYAREEALWETVLAADPLAKDGSKRLAEQLADSVLPDHRRVVLYAPLGVGHHVDHQVVHAAAQRLSEMGYRVAFYEDYPYAEQTEALQSALAIAGAESWHVETIPLSALDLSAKVSALGYYRSQMSILFNGAAAMPNRVWAFAATRSAGEGLAERLWWPPQA